VLFERIRDTGQHNTSCQRHYAANDDASIVDVDEMARVTLRIVHGARRDKAAVAVDPGDDTGGL
jgi:hypothetical protein